MDIEKVPRGCLTFQKKIYPVYDGHNTIGRNPKAIINIKNLNISQQHAVITIIDDGRHFISDFKSANGTSVNNQQLHPLKLYPLNNGASIKFGNILCTYKKLSCNESLLDTTEASQDFSQNFYATNTQAVELENSEMSVNEMPTQAMFASPLGIHEMATQVVNPLSIHEMQTQVVNPLSIHEMQTQSVQFDESPTHDSSNESIDFMTMQKPSETQAFELKNKKDLISDAEGPSTPVPSSLESDIVPVKLNASKKISDSEASTPDFNKSVVQSPEKPESDEEPPMSQICPVKTGLKNVIESDSDDEMPSTSGKHRSRYIISDDDETDIEDEVNGPQDRKVPQNNPDPEVPQSNPSFSESFRLELKDDEEKKIIEENPKEETNIATTSAIPEDHLYCRSFIEDPTEKISEDLEQNTKDEGPSSVVNENEENRLLTEETLQKNAEIHEEEEIGGVERSNIVPETNYVQKDQDQNTKDQGFSSVVNENEENRLLTEETPPKIAEIDKIEEIGDAERSNVVPENKNALKDQIGDGLSDGETQELLEDPKSQLDNKNEERNIDMDIFDQPTQQYGFDFVNEEDKLKQENEEQTKPIENNQENEEEKITEENIFVKPIPPQLDKDDDDIYLQPTQELATLQNTDNNLPRSPPGEENEKQTESVQNDEEKESQNVLNNFIFVKPQQLNKSDDDIYLQPTQELFISNNRSPQMELPSNDIEKSILEDGEENPDEITPLKEHDFLPPLPALLPLNPSTSKSLPSAGIDDDDELFLPPTQALEMLHKEDESKLPSDVLLEKNSDSNEVEDQLEMLFASQSDHRFVATQQLVDVLEEKNEDIIEDSMLEGTSFGKWMSKKSHFNSIDTIREILDESMTDNDTSKEEEVVKSTKVNDVEEKENSKNNDIDEGKKNKNVCEKAESLDLQNKGSQSSIASSSSSGSSKSSTRRKIKNKNEKKKEEIENTIIQSDNDVKKDTQNEETKEKGKRKGRKPMSSSNSSNSLDGQITTENKESQSSISSSSSTRSTSSRKKTKIQNKEEPKEETDTIPETPTASSRGRRGKKLKEIPEEKPIEMRRTRSNVDSSEQNTEESIKKTKSTKEQSQEETKSTNDHNTRTTRSQSEENHEEKKSTTRQSKRQANINLEKKSSEDDESKIVQNTRITRTTKPQSLENQEDRSTTRQSKRKANTDVDLKEDSSEDDSKSVDEIRKKREPGVASTTSNDSKPSTSGRKKRSNNSEDDFMPKIPKMTSSSTSIDSTASTSQGRKRSNNSDEEFTPKVQTVASPKRTPGRPRRNQKEEAVIPVSETPPTRTMSSRSKKINLDEEIISVSSSSSTIEVMSVPSSSSTPIDPQPTKRGRKLSANSRALKNAEEKGTKTRKSSIQDLSPILETPERSKRIHKPKVVFTMMDSPELESLIRQLGGSVVDTVDACTVLVTENVKRSQKLLRAVGQGKPICSPKWLYACKKSFKFLDPWDYILEDKEAEKKWEFSLKESLQRSSKSKLLENYTFQVMVTAAADVLKGAIEACGAKCVARNLAKAGTDNLVIVATADQKTKFAKIVKENPEIKVVEPEAIFDGTLRQEFRFNRHLLT